MNHKIMKASRGTRGRKRESRGEMERRVVDNKGLPDRSYPAHDRRMAGVAMDLAIQMSNQI